MKRLWRLITTALLVISFIGLMVISAVLYLIIAIATLDHTIFQAIPKDVRWLYQCTVKHYNKPLNRS